MNIYLIPYTRSRHLVPAIHGGGAALLAWWGMLVVVVGAGPTLHRIGLYWTQAFESTMFLAVLAGAIGATSLLVEGSLRRRRPFWRLLYAALAGAVSFLGTVSVTLMFRQVLPYMTTADRAEVVADPSLVTLRFSLALWALAGVMSGVGPFVARKAQRVVARAFGLGVDGALRPEASKWSQRFSELFYHTGGGFSGAVFGALVWHLLGLYDAVTGDLYLAAAGAGFTWGFVHGLLTWGIPDELYAGWVRILSPERYGLRIPVDHVDGSPAERFVGHFPRGLDLYMPAEHGVAELHASFVVDRNHNYAVRGLSVQSTVLKRTIEKVKLHYDPMRPAPLETELRMGDRVLMGVGKVYSEVEFIMLPKEEL